LPTPENEKYAKIPYLGIKYTQLSSSQKIKKIIPEKFSLLSSVLLTPLTNIHSRLSPRIFEKNGNDPNGILRGQGDTDLRKNLKSKISWQTPFKKLRKAQKEKVFENLR
jgi:hypothetical protein